MIRQNDLEEQPVSQELVNKAVAHLAPLYRQYVNEENVGKAERQAMQLGRSIVEWEHKCGFNPEFMPLVAERVQELVPESEYEVESAFTQMRRVFFDLLGYFVASQRHEIMHELMNDKVLDALEEEGFFEMMALERSLEFEDGDEEYEDEDEDEEESCCDDDEECCDDEDEDDECTEDDECECYECCDEDDEN
jgi:hypothetical protein